MIRARVQRPNKGGATWLTVLGALAASAAGADVRLPGLIGDSMVLQRESRIAVWGWADPGEKVRIAFHGKEVTTRTDSQGQWSTSLGPYPAGGPHDITITGRNRLVLHDVLLGDVWLASGQSNMEFPLKSSGEWKTGVYNAEQEISGAHFPQMRLFKVHQKVAFRPAKDVDAEGWVAVTPQTVGNFSAVAYLFGRELHQRYRVPVGLIEADWGGTVAEAWVSEAGLKAFPEFGETIDTLTRAHTIPLNDPNRATVLFNSMINPLTPFRIKGVIWYQGESNAADNRATQYRTLFPALINDWRRNWGYEFPFLYVQLAGYGHNEPDPAEYPWAELREAQSMTLRLPKTGMASAIDIGDENDVHPKDKQSVAHRLALAAANVAYGETLVHSGPTYQSMQIEGDQIRIKFSDVGSGITIKDKYGYGRGFEIAGADGKFVWAQAREDGQDIVVSSSVVKKPVAVRYNWSNTPDGNVFNEAGLPAVPFRTEVSRLSTIAGER